jgi:hypothetical protein
MAAQCPARGGHGSFATTIANACVASKTTITVDISGGGTPGGFTNSAGPKPGYFTPAIMDAIRYTTATVSVTPGGGTPIHIMVPCIGSALFTHVQAANLPSGGAQVWAAVVCTATVLSVAVFDSAANAHAWASRAIYNAPAPAVPNMKLSGILHSSAKTAVIVGGVLGAVVVVGMVLLSVLYKGPARGTRRIMRPASNAM